ncbi:enoyl-CoA hydratase/isomerase family protein [Arthrobacter ramosus]|uniref:Enoyl-CoA hydratase/isomerase family protein n=1 Tax=Arthrobacter ramosus TaxID=1672 RepID=A0ABV5Y4I8_ARTRM|nr:enoyl-CoA hydratase/isomerase family protein [Arthrobacter ramosus]
MIDISEQDGIATVRISHGKVNALDLELARGLRDAFESFSSYRAVVLTGNGRAFSAGADLRRLLDEGEPYAVEFLTALEELYATAFACRMPVVAAIEGHAIAGGCVLAATADVRLMSGGTIGLPELVVGVPFPVVTVEIMRHVLGHRLASVVYGAKAYAPDDALRAGLIDEVVAADLLLASARERAEALAASPPSTFTRVKGSLRAPAAERIGAARGEGALMARLWTLPEVSAALSRVLAR